MQTTKPVRALIVGGGIGGLATSIALERVGIQATVFERAPVARETGSGVQIWTNGMEALQELGLAEQIQQQGALIERFQIRTWRRGTVLVDVPLGDFARAHNDPVVCVSRCDLHRTLAARAGQVQFGMNCIGFEQHSDGVTLRFDNGHQEHGTLLIGADGIRSAVRTRQVEHTQPRYRGYHELRALTRFSDPHFPPGAFWIFWGHGARFGMADVGHGLVWMFAVVNARERTVKLSNEQKQDLLSCFQGWAAPVEALIAATPPDDIYQTNIYDIEPMQQWGSGPVTLLGDAAHAITPNLGRGAGEALVDATTLAASLRGCAPTDVSQALRRYEAQRIGPTAIVARRSRRMGWMGQWQNGPACTFRSLLMRTIGRRVMVRAIELDFKHAV